MKRRLIPKVCIFIGLWILSMKVTGQSFSGSTLDMRSDVTGISLHNPTSLQFGPDGRLYVAQQNGEIKIFSIERTGKSAYRVTSAEKILLVKQIPNYNDDGTKAENVNSRQVVGLYVAGTAANPVIYVASGDARIGAGQVGDVNLCTNSGTISKLTKEGGQWKKLDLVRGLPHSEENHAANGLAFDKKNNRLLVASGGMTNAGAPSKNFAMICEYALASAILSIDLNKIESMPVKDANGAHPYVYDLPTVDDPTRPNLPDGSDVNDPFGGNDGLNMAKLVKDGPVQIYARGFRNIYDVIITEKGNVYTFDNGANVGWGGYPENEGNNGQVTNNYVQGEPGSSSPGPNDPKVNNLDGFHFIGNINTYSEGSYYGGHPNPIRANPAGAGLYTHSGPIDGGIGVWRTKKDDPESPLPADWPPIPVDMAFPEEGDFQNPGETNRALLTLPSSTNGLCEYTASNFNGTLKGDILAAAFDGYIARIRLNATGTGVLNKLGSKKQNQDPHFATGFGDKPLDITAQGDGVIFPGTVWIALYASNDIIIYEPEESTVVCTGVNSENLDEDKDGYTNADEISNGTNPCSGSSKPNDFDGDYISDLNDPDDDNDGIPDINDYFAIDPSNGTNTHLPVKYSLFNNDPGTGFFGLGFTGLMTNGKDDYLNQYELQQMVAGGAIGALTVNDVPEGDCAHQLNNQMYGFQFGVNINQSTKPIVIKSRMIGGNGFFDSQTPKDDQSQGIFLGVGDQDNYLKMVLNANGGSGGIEVAYEENGEMERAQYSIPNIPATSIELQILLDPSTGMVRTRYVMDGGEATEIGSPVQLKGKLLDAVQGEQAIAVGIIATSRNSGVPFNATWDNFEVMEQEVTAIAGKSEEYNNLKVYPNPVNNILYIIPAVSNTTANVEISDVSGMLVKQTRIRKINSEGVEIDVSDLTPGIYFIKVTYKGDENKEMIKVVKQ